MADFIVGEVTKRVFQRSGRVIEGFAVQVHLNKYNEDQEVLVDSMDAKQIAAAVRDLVARRDAINALNGSQE